MGQFNSETTKERQSNIAKYYNNIIGNYPYDYQLKTFERLSEGKNIILNIPTGAGKTWASIIPFLYFKESQKNFPHKLIYSLPLRTLVNSIHEDVINNKEIKKRFPNIAKQTGEYKDDKYFESDIIFSTIDQTLSSFLCFPLGLSERQANINAGALIGSYLVFDEFHLLDENRSMSTTLEAIKLLDNFCRFCIMTATLTSPLIEMLKKKLPNVCVISLNDFPEDRGRIKSLIPLINKKHVFVQNTILNAPEIIKKHKQKTIVLCNRVETAQKIFNDISDGIKMLSLKPELFCIHSRFFDEDRKKKEEKIRKMFNRGSKANCILISTQVIEAGMDISCDVMHTEISPANSFLQRAGRCARFESETGEIYVYDVLDLSEQEKTKNESPNDDDKNEIQALNSRYRPYCAKICNATFEALKEIKTLDNDIPKELIEKVLSASELQLSNTLNQNEIDRKCLIRKCWHECKKNRYRETIREIQNVEVILINENQKDEVARYPNQFQEIGLYKWTLASWLKELKETTEDSLAWELKENVFLDMADEVEWYLTPVNPDSLPSRVYLNAEYFGYTESIGFNRLFPQTFGKISPIQKTPENKQEYKGLEVDTFYQHNKGLLICFKKDFISDIDFTVKEIKALLDDEKFSKDDLMRIVNLMFILHDYGKLNKEWQAPMQKYQKEKTGKVINEVLAHTTYDRTSDQDKLLAKRAKLYPRPKHAAIGAKAMQDAFNSIFNFNYGEDLRIAVSMAIAKHHSSSIEGQTKFSGFEIPDYYYSEIEKLFNEYNFDLKPDQKMHDGILDDFENEIQELLYLIFVRWLRLCDQKATENLKLYYND